MPSTRDRLVATAKDLFLKQGYASTGVGQILETAGARSGSLYYFFPAKEDLLLEVLRWYQEHLGPEVIQPVIDRVRDPIERIFGVLEGYRQMLRSAHFAQGCPIGNLALEVGDAHPAARRLIAANVTQWCRAIEQCLGEGSGRLSPQVDWRHLALFVLTTMEGAVMLSRTYRSLKPYESAVAVLRDYFRRLVAEGARRPTRRRAVLKNTPSPPRRKPRSPRRRRSRTQRSAR
jgi:AcrR family transcriptional regulator